jgi:D-alanine-D-alanine ligase
VKKLRIVALMDADLMPPARARAKEVLTAPWRTEYDVVQTLSRLGHEVHVLGVGGELNPIRRAIRAYRPHVFFNLLESFDDVRLWDQNVVGYLEMLKMKYTGCNSRGLLLARDKALTKKLLSYHRIQVAEFAVARRGRKFRRPRKLAFPLFVKSLSLDASIGIAQASVVDSDEKLAERVHFVHDSVGTDALVESYIEGRELTVGLLGNHRLTALPIWELTFEKMPESWHKIATERLKFSPSYQEKHGILSGRAVDLPPGLEKRIQEIGRRVFRVLYLNGYARIDLRVTDAGKVYVIEANPNPQIAHGEDFAEAALATGLDYGPLLQRIVDLGCAWEPLTAA